MNNISVDFSNKLGKIKPLHGVNNGPKTLIFSIDTSEYFKQAGIPFSRLHDTEYPYGSGHFVDIPCIFKNFDADPEDPSAYDFNLTDEYIDAIYQAGAKVFYRLGVSIEHASKKYNIFPPKDYVKWAKICAGIIRHYNEGWASGYFYNIEYWEIWNEPENPPMWQGSPEDYYKLYEITSKYLKSEFPKIKVGGYASCGFYSLTRENTSQFEQSFVTYFRNFLEYITAKKTKSPLDFFSWHLYSDNVEEMVIHANFVTEMLIKYGFGNTESIINEWNYIAGDKPFEDMKKMIGASYVAAIFCALQNSPVDAGMFYDSQPSMVYCGLFNFPTPDPTKTYYSFKAFNELYKLKNEVYIQCDTDRIYTCGAVNSSEGAILLCNYKGDDTQIRLDFNGFTYSDGVFVDFYLLDDTHDMALIKSEKFYSGMITSDINLKNNSVTLIKIKNIKE